MRLLVKSSISPFFKVIFPIAQEHTRVGREGSKCVIVCRTLAEVRRRQTYLVRMRFVTLWEPSLPVDPAVIWCAILKPSKLLFDDREEPELPRLLSPYLS